MVAVSFTKKQTIFSVLVLLGLLALATTINAQVNETVVNNVELSELER